MMADAPALVILMPLAAAVLIAVVAIRRLALAHVLATCGAGLSAIFSWFLLQQTISGGPISYHMGGWAPPFGIAFQFGQLSAFVAAVVTSMATLSLAWSRPPVRDELEAKGPAFYAVSSLLLCGLIGMCLTGDAFNMFVFLEVASLAGYAVVGAGRGHSRVAAFRYLMLGATGASLYLLGVGYLYAATGTLNMIDLAERIQGADLAPVALAFIFTGLALKMGLFPLHAWMPDAYTESPSATSAFIAPIMTKVMAFALIRFLYHVFGVETVIGPFAAGTILAWMGALAVIVGAAVATAQTDFRRLLAWSSVGQIGYIAIGAGIGTPLAVAAALLHVLNHALMKGALFYVAGAARVRNVSDLRGLSKRMPFTAGCLVIAAMSLVGIPPLGGFFSKWYLLRGAFAADQMIFVVAIVIGSLLAVFYVFRIIEAACLQNDDREEHDRPSTEAPLSMNVPLAITVVAIVASGVCSQMIMASWLGAFE